MNWGLPNMPSEYDNQIQAGRIIVIGNEKGGSGKSTVAMHLAIALMKCDKSVSTIDLDSRQKTLTHYIENRYEWGLHTSADISIPNHVYFVENMNNHTPEDDIADGTALAEQISALTAKSDFTVIDTPGRNSYLGRLVLSLADVVITPLNDSLVDLDVLGTIDRQALAVTGTSHYSEVVEEARQQRFQRDGILPDWIVLRNRLSTLGSRNTRLVGEALGDLAQRLNFRRVEGLAERVIFREFYHRGLTALDSLHETILGTRPTLSHLAARLEIEKLVNALGLLQTSSGGLVGRARDAA